MYPWTAQFPLHNITKRLVYVYGPIDIDGWFEPPTTSWYMYVGTYLGRVEYSTYPKECGVGGLMSRSECMFLITRIYTVT